jgi:hypothetical protein
LGRFLQPDPIGFAGGDANLFRYCGGDPVNFIDPFGDDAEVVNYGGNVSIRMRISFWGGAQSQGPDYLTYATGRLNNQTFGSYNVTFATDGGPSNSYRLERGTGAGQTWKYLWQSSASDGKSFVGGLGARFNTSGQDVFLHELLHLLGAKDRYNQKTGVPHEGFENNIMGGPKSRGNEINEGNIRDIIENRGRGVAGHLVMQYVSSVQAGVAGALRAINAHASVNGPGIGMVTVSGPSGVQGYFVPAGWSQSTSGMWAPSGMWGLSGFAATFGHAGGARPSAGIHPDEQYHKLN